MFFLQVKRVVVYLGRDKTMQLLEELMTELELTDAVSSAVTHMDNPPYYRITSSYKIPSVTGVYLRVSSDVGISINIALSSQGLIVNSSERVFLLSLLTGTASSTNTMVPGPDGHHDHKIKDPNMEDK